MIWNIIKSIFNTIINILIVLLQFFCVMAYTIIEIIFIKYFIRLNDKIILIMFIMLVAMNIYLLNKAEQWIKGY